MVNSNELILDIDDTLAETAFSGISFMRKKFKHPDPVWEILAKFEQPGNVPEWQSIEAQEFLLKLMNNEEFLLNLPFVTYSQEVLNKLRFEHPIRYYMTSRSSSLEAVTINWLKKNSFPVKKVIFRDSTNIDTDWKLKFLIKEGLDTYIFIDNELKSFETEIDKYRGKLIWLNRFNKATEKKVVSLSTWQLIYDYLSQ